jgi:hypothetical protein
MKNYSRIYDQVREIKKSTDISPLDSHEKLGSMLEECLKLKDLLKVKRYEEVHKFNQYTKEYLDSRPNNGHVKDVEQTSTLVRSRLQAIWSAVIDCESVINKELSVGEKTVILLHISFFQLINVQITVF